MPPEADEILRVSGLWVRYSELVAVRAVSLRLRRGELLAVLGPNGAGKSSLLRAISGLVRPSAGHVVHSGTDITGWHPDRVARRGVCHVLEGRGIFPELSVAENLRLAARGVPSRGLEGALGKVHDYFPRLQQRRRQQAGSLSGGEQQQLAIARALVQRPTVLLLDEMSLGLAPKIVDSLFEILARINADGVATILVEQYVGRALRIADSTIVLEKGSVRSEGPAAELAAQQDLASSYLGGEVTGRDDSFDGGEPVTVHLAPRLIRELDRRAREQGVTTEELAAVALIDRLREDV